MPSPEPRGGHEAARVHHSDWWRSSSIAARGARAAAERMRRVGMLVSGGAEDAELRDRIAAFLHTLEQLGWSNGRSLQIDIREGAGNSANMRRHAIGCPCTGRRLTSGTAGPAALIQATRTIRLSPTFLIPSAPASSTPWRGRAATSRASCNTNTA